MMRFKSTVVLIVIASATVYAQQARIGLKETLLWMHNFVADNSSQYTGQDSVDNHTCKLGSPNCQQRHDVSTFDSQGCSTTITWSATLNSKNNGTYTYRMSLKDLDPKSASWVKEGSFQNAVEVDTTNHVAAVMETFTPPNGRTEEIGAQSLVDLVFDSGDHAKRFIEAFKHAIELCGGKPSAF
jgi:hypothetical protein